MYNQLALSCMKTTERYRHNACDIDTDAEVMKVLLQSQGHISVEAHCRWPILAYAAAMHALQMASMQVEC